MIKAIDITILPPDEIMDLSIEVSKKVVGPGRIQLNKRNQLPHITLLFGGVEEDDLSQVWEIVSDVCQSFGPLELEIPDIRYASSTGLHITRSDKLVSLHNKLVESVSPLMSYDVSVGNYKAPESVLEISTSWVNNFLQNSSGENYDPHMTIGDGELQKEDYPNLPIKFIADRIALCHLGNLCTCAEILFETKLEK
ncbi:hypothetical protein GF389_03025 [Candidatus Dojkabacteria bacterium]|nr:hypothetical protein [Candidatus Dojkabacteria bacterium]